MLAPEPFCLRFRLLRKGALCAQRSSGAWGRSLAALTLGLVIHHGPTPAQALTLASASTLALPRPASANLLRLGPSNSKATDPQTASPPRRAAQAAQTGQMERLAAPETSKPVVTPVVSPVVTEVESEGDEDFDDFDFGPERESGWAEVERIMSLPPAAPEDPYGPRPAGIPKVSLAQLHQYASQNPLIEGAQAKVAEMRARVSQARFAWIPTLKLSAFLSPGANIKCEDLVLATRDPAQNLDFQYCRPGSDPNLDLGRIKDYLKDIGNAGISLRVQGDLVLPIFTFGKLATLKKLARSGLSLAKLQELQKRQETALKTQEAYLALQLSRASIEILNEAWSVLKNHEKRILEGKSKDPDNRSEFELAQIEVARKMQEARRIEFLALSALWAIAGKAAPPHFDIEDTQLVAWEVDEPKLKRDDYRALAIRERPEAQMARAFVQLRHHQERLARANFYPDLALVLGFRLGYASAADTPDRLYYSSRPNFSTITAGLGVSWDLAPHHRIFELSAARAQLQQADAQYNLARRLLALEVEKAFGEWQSAKQDRQLIALAITRARRLIAAQEAKASIGGGSYKDLSRNLKRWAELEFEGLSAIARQNTAIAQLSRAVGRDLRAAPAFSASAQPLPAATRRPSPEIQSR